jgi:hypothetical protein
VGTTAKEVFRKLKVSEATFYTWRRKSAGMCIAELREFRHRREENIKRKKRVADLSPDKHGETWVRRSGPSRSLPGCIEEPAEDPRHAWERPCWRAETILNVFGRDGRYLGQVETPPGLRPAPPSNPFVRGDRLYAVVEDDAGTIMVNRYRLVLPGESPS